MSTFPEQNNWSLSFKDAELEKEFTTAYDKEIRIPLRYGIIISILSWYSAIVLIPLIIPETLNWLPLLTFLFIGSYFGFIIYATYKSAFKGYYHILGAISNAWAGLYAIYYCDQFPNGEHLTLPVLIFIIFFGSYMVRLRWFAGFVAAFTYVAGYQIYIIWFSDLTIDQVLLYGFVAWMTLVFAILAGRVAESNKRLSFVQKKTIEEQQEIIEGEKEVLLKEVHHRVKNNLQIILSLIKLQKSKLQNVHAEEEFREMESRIMSMSIVHKRIQRTSGYDEISLKDYIEELYDHVQSQYTSKHGEATFTISDEFLMNMESSIPFGIILNELMTNFFKHCDGDQFSISVVTDKQGDHTLTYQDNGKGFPAALTSETVDSLGLELIDMLSYQLDGGMRFETNNGARIVVEFSL